MDLLNIIDNIYENSHFTTALIVSVILLVLLFIIVLIIGIRDAKKDKKPKLILEEDIKDVSFDIPSEENKIKEDVTFEMPVLTKNLENFKKNLEEEIQNEEMAEVRKMSKPDEEDKKVIKVLDMDEIKDTAILELGIKNNKVENKEDNSTIDEKKDNDSVYDLDDDF